MSTYVIDAEPYPLEFDLRTTGLLMIDMQRDFLEVGGIGDRTGNDLSLLRQTIDPCREVLQMARGARMFVVHTREGYRPDLSDAWPGRIERGRFPIRIGDPGPMGRLLVRGEPGYEIIPEVAPLPSEPVVDKPGHGAFYATELLHLLTNRHVRTLMVCGVTTEVCVSSTVREASDRGFECVVLSDCVGSYHSEMHLAGLKMIKAHGGIFGWVSTSLELKGALSQGCRPVGSA